VPVLLERGLCLVEDAAVRTRRPHPRVPDSCVPNRARP
jgi:hypothetical protein